VRALREGYQEPMVGQDGEAGTGRRAGVRVQGGRAGGVTGKGMIHGLWSMGGGIVCW
jgi:hypothetical protein